MLRRILQPTVIVGHQAHRRVSHLGLPGQEDFWHVGHADQVAARLAQEVTLGLGAQAWPFDAGVGEAAMDLQATPGGGGPHGIDQYGTDGFRCRYMGGHAPAEEGQVATRGAAATDP